MQMINFISGGRGLFRTALGLALIVTASVALSQVQVTTYHNDNARTGLNANETILTPANVNANTFGLLFTLPVDGQVYAQPLYLPNVTIPGKGVHNVVYVATEHNSLYAFDADSNTGANAQPLWHVNFGPSVPNGDTGSDDINPEIGITGTPVIYMRATGDPLIFLVTKSKVNTAGGPVYIQRLVAISAVTGYIPTGGVKQIMGSTLGTGDGSSGKYVAFNSLIQHNRAALLLVPPPVGSTAHTKLFVTFASHGDNGPYHGYVFTYDADTMALLNIFNTTPNAKTDPSGYPLAAGGIWQGGAGPASDGSSVFFATGNGWFDPTTQAYGDSVLRFDTTTYRVLDYFTPSDQLSLDDYDSDLGSGGVMLIPPSAGGTANKKLMVQSGKEGTLYLIDTTNLGKYGTSDSVVQELPGVMGSIFGCPAFFHNSVYFGPQYSSLVSFALAGGHFAKTTPTAYSPTNYMFPGPTPSISANGLTNGIVWAIQTDGYTNGLPSILHAYDALNVGRELYNGATTSGRDNFGAAVKFATPTIANGKVYAGATGQVGVFGLGSWAALPTVTPANGNYVNQVVVQVKETTPGATIYYTTDGSDPTTASTKYTGPVTFTVGTIFKARAFVGSAQASGVVERDYLINATIGTGTGLQGSYYNGVQTPGGTPTLTEIDPVINFNWNGNPPVAGVGATNWAGEWTGHIQAETTGTYTLTTNSDDGVQVYINGTLVIDDFNQHAPTLDSATLSFVAGQKYSIDIKYFQAQGGSVLQLFWSTYGLPTQIVPTTQLYPN